jgi:hypothetical protein
MTDNDDKVVPFPTPQARRDAQQLAEKLVHLPADAQWAVAGGVEIARMFADLPPEHRERVSAIVEAFARVPEAHRARVLSMVRELAMMRGDGEPPP